MAIRRLIYLLLISLLSGNTLLSQQLPALIPYYCAGKWGYCDSNKKIILHPKWEEAQLFLNGKAIVKTATDFALIDSLGNYIIATERHWNGKLNRTNPYETFNFHTDSGGYGLLNDEGKILVQPLYDNIADLFCERGSEARYRAVSIKDQHGIIREDGTETIPCIYDQLYRQNKQVYTGEKNKAKDSTTYFIVSKGVKYGLVDINNKIKIPIIYDGLRYGADMYGSNVTYPENDCRLRGVLNASDSGRIGAITENNEVIIPIIYESVKPGKFANHEGFYVEKNGKWGFIGYPDTFNVAIAIDNLPLGIYPNPDSTYSAYIGDEISVYSKTGKLIAKTEFNRIQFDKHGKPFAWKSTGTDGMILKYMQLNPKTFTSAGKWIRYRDTSHITDYKPYTFKCGSGGERYEPVSIKNKSGKIFSFKKDSITFSVSDYLIQILALKPFYVVKGIQNNVPVTAVVDTALNYILRPQGQYKIIGGSVADKLFIVQKDTMYAVIDSNLQLVCRFQSLPITGVTCNSSGIHMLADLRKRQIRGFDLSAMQFRELTVLDSNGTQHKNFEHKILGAFPIFIDKDGTQNLEGPNLEVRDSANRVAIMGMDGTHIFPELAFRHHMLMSVGRGHFIVDSGKLVDSHNTQLLTDFVFERCSKIYIDQPWKERLFALVCQKPDRQKTYGIYMDDRGTIYAEMGECK